MKEKVIQFGEGNFLRAFADAFIEKMNGEGSFNGSAVIVKPTPRGNLDKFIKQQCRYHLLLRGIQNSEVVEELTEIRSVSRCINPYEDFEAFLALAEKPDFRFIISNTTEAGIAYDESCLFSDRPALSFPGKLTQLLYARYQAHLPGFILLPCELIDRNADMLKECVLRYAKQWALGDDFLQWVETENRFCNTLVDRIVTGYPSQDDAAIFEKLGEEDLLLDTAEPFHLWVIEGEFEKEFPLQSAGINAVWTQDVTPYKKQKVRVLNGAHTVMTFPALLCGIATVKEALDDDQIGAFLRRTLYEEIVPLLDDAKGFADAVLERFQNPYLHHQLTSIALNSVSKFSVRVLPSSLDCLKAKGRVPLAFSVSLAALIYYYKINEPSDDAKAIRFIKENPVDAILENQDLWGCDISVMKADVQNAFGMIETQGIREAIAWAMS